MRAIGHISGQLRDVIALFVGDRRGNVAVIFAITLVPLLGFVGAAVDYSRASAARSAMQKAMDSAALMVSKDIIAKPAMSAADITAKATAYFNALHTGTNTGAITLTATYTSNAQPGAAVTITGNGTVATDFMKVLGYPTLAIGTSSTTTWGNSRMRVAMALDVTGSMQFDGKIAAMKSAAKNLVSALQSTASTADDVYISIIPFAETVNVGTSNKNANWIKWGDWEASNRTCTFWLLLLCLATGPADHGTWNGCVTDRDQPYDTTLDAATADVTRFPANQDNTCPAQLMPLTSAYASSNVSAIKAKIDSLSPSGSTNQPIGMVWAWQSLNAGAPLNAPAKDTNYTYTDAIILLSDGLNTKDRWYGDGVSPSSASQVNARHKLLCDNIKAPVNGKQQTVVYTIQVNTDGDPESDVLKYCADSGNFYMSGDAGQIASAFAAIGTSLTQLRVSK